MVCKKAWGNLKRWMMLHPIFEDILRRYAPPPAPPPKGEAWR